MKLTSIPVKHVVIVVVIIEICNVFVIMFPFSLQLELFSDSVIYFVLMPR